MNDKFTCGYPSPSRRLTSPYGPRTIGDKWHDGTDFGDADYAPPYNDPLFAMHDGVVAFVGYVGGYGDNVIIINAYDVYDKKYSTLLAHGKDVIVSVGDKVKRGQKVATMWKTGTSAIHVHCEVRTQWYNSKTYWNKHYKHGGGEFYSSYDPMNFITEDIVEANIDEAILKNLSVVYEKLQSNFKEFVSLMDELVK